VLRVAEVAKRLSISQALCYRLIAKNVIPHHLIGKAIRISEEQLQQYLEETKRERDQPSPARRQPSRPRLKHLSL
jgi:excisionase family DNA binding protein